MRKCPWCNENIKETHISEKEMVCNKCGHRFEFVDLKLSKNQDFNAYKCTPVMPKFSKDKRPMPFTMDMIGGVKIDKVFLRGKQINLPDVKPTGRILLRGRDGAMSCRGR